MTMHCAKIENSPRLQRVLALLNGGRWYSTRTIVQEADVCAVNSIISELRCNGYVIEKQWHEGKCYYRLQGEQAA